MRAGELPGNRLANPPTSLPDGSWPPPRPPRSREANVGLVAIALDALVTIVTRHGAPHAGAVRCQPKVVAALEALAAVLVALGAARHRILVRLVGLALGVRACGGGPDRQRVRGSIAGRSQSKRRGWRAPPVAAPPPRVHTARPPGGNAASARFQEVVGNRAAGRGGRKALAGSVEPCARCR